LDLAREDFLFQRVKEELAGLISDKVSLKTRAITGDELASITWRWSEDSEKCI
jgi:hypothetical protein